MPGFHEIQFPPRISYGARARPAIAADVIELDSGQFETNQKWSSARRSFDAGYGIKSIQDINEIVAFYLCREGVVNGFRWKDFSDFTTAVGSVGTPSNTDCDLGLGDNATQEFQLRKKYVSGSETIYRAIEKPVDGTVVVALDGTPQNLGSDYTLNLTTGVITFSTAPGTGVSVTAGCEFDVPVIFAPELAEGIENVYEAFDSGAIPSIPIVELINPSKQLDTVFYGGFYDHSTQSSVTLSITELQGRHHNVKPGDASVAFRLPDPAGKAKGGPYFYLQVDAAAAFPVAVEDHLGTQITTVSAGDTKTVNLGVDGVGADLWIVF